MLMNPKFRQVHQFRLKLSINSESTAKLIATSARLKTGKLIGTKSRKSTTAPNRHLSNPLPIVPPNSQPTAKSCSKRHWLPLRHSHSRYLLLAATLLVSALFTYLQLWHPHWFPQMFIDGQGLTAFKIGYEYALIAVHLAVAALCYRRMRTQRAFNSSRRRRCSSSCALSWSRVCSCTCSCN